MRWPRLGVPTRRTLVKRKLHRVLGAKVQVSYNGCCKCKQPRVFMSFIHEPERGMRSGGILCINNNTCANPHLANVISDCLLAVLGKSVSIQVKNGVVRRIAVFQVSTPWGKGVAVHDATLVHKHVTCLVSDQVPGGVSSWHHLPEIPMDWWKRDS
jgi:hypothetical protein